MGMEMLIKALLNAIGYTQADLDAAIAWVKSFHARGELALKEMEARSTRIEEKQDKILLLLQNAEVPNSTTDKEPK